MTTATSQKGISYAIPENSLWEIIKMDNSENFTKILLFIKSSKVQAEQYTECKHH